jgi:hypothetical protein
MDKVALGQVFSEYFGFPCQFSFHQLLYSLIILSSKLYSLGTDSVGTYLLTYMNVLSSVLELLHTDRETDMAKLIRAFLRLSW